MSDFINHHVPSPFNIQSCGNYHVKKMKYSAFSTFFGSSCLKLQIRLSFMSDTGKKRYLTKKLLKGKKLQNVSKKLTN